MMYLLIQQIHYMGSTKYHLVCRIIENICYLMTESSLIKAQSPQSIICSTVIHAIAICWISHDCSLSASLPLLRLSWRLMGFSLLHLYSL